MSSSITRCIIQLETVDAVTGILFGKSAFKVEGPTPTLRRPGDSNDNNSQDWPEQAPVS